MEAIVPGNGINPAPGLKRLPDELTPTKVSLIKVELVTTLKRHATKILKEVNEQRSPVLITEHGQPSAYLVDVETFEDTQERLRLLEGLARGEEAVRKGRILNQKQAKQRMAKWLR
jgi:prevent-host-death family protein